MFKVAKSKSLAGSLSHTLKELVRKNSQAVSAHATVVNTSSEVDKSKIKDTMHTYTNGKISFATTVSDFNLISERVGESLPKHALNSPNKVAFAFPHQKMNLTFSELEQRVKCAMENIHSLGLKKGDRVAFALPNCHELLVNFVAASQLGLISVMLNPAYQSVEFEYMLNKTNCKALFIFDSFKTLNHIDMINKMCPELQSSVPGELKAKTLPDLRHVVVLNSPFSDEKKAYKGTWQFDQLSKPRSQHTNLELPYIDIEDPCVILFTSGTTGKPKGAVLTHHGLNNSCHLSFQAYGHAEGLKNSCVPIPFFHVYGLSTGILDTLLQGQTKVIPFYFPETTTTMKAIQDFKCTSVRGTPTQFIDLINHPDRIKYDLTSFETMIVAASTVPPDLLNKATEILKIKNIAVGYGMTEMSSCHSLTTYSDKYLQTYQRTFESVGRPIPFSETKVVDPVTGEILPLNTPGELMVRGPHVIKEYWDEKEKNKELFDKYGYLKTGDICTMDEEGYIFFKSRSKDLIIRGGANLYPAEIESYLRTHPDVLDAQVFGVPDERMGEEVYSWIKARPGSQLTEESIKSFCKGNISHFKIPRYIKFVQSFPVNANQKVVKSIMRDQAIKELNQQ